MFALEVNHINTAVSYYGDYRDAIDPETEAADQASLQAEQAWRVRRELIT